MIIKSEYLTDEEKKYYDRFIEFMNKVDYIPQEGEVWKQCIDENYYKPYWFISNKAKCYTLADKEIRLVKPWLKPGGRNKKNCPEWTNYIKAIYPQWERENEKGHEPSCYYWYKHPVQEWILYYFGSDSDRYNLLHNREYFNIHHKVEFDWNKPQQFSNRIENLQGLKEDDSISKADVKRGTATYADYANKKAHSALHAFADRDIDRVYIQALLDGKPMLTMETLKWLISYNLKHGQAFVTVEHRDGSVARYVHNPESD